MYAQTVSNLAATFKEDIFNGSPSDDNLAQWQTALSQEYDFIKITGMPADIAYSSIERRPTPQSSEEYNYFIRSKDN